MGFSIPGKVLIKGGFKGLREEVLKLLVHFLTKDFLYLLPKVGPRAKGF